MVQTIQNFHQFMHTNIPSQIQVQVVKAGWFKRSYLFVSDDKVIGQLDYEKSYAKKAKGVINGQEFFIRRSGFWKHFIEINSTSQQLNTRIAINWRNQMKIVDSAGNQFLFKHTGIWKNKWQWFDKHERSLIEIASKNLSRKNRGLIEIKYPEMTDALFWIIVSWFVILCSESDAAGAAVT
jgi:hypothetical protein